MFQTNVVCGLWDLVDEGIDVVLDRVAGEAGASGVSVPAVCGPVEQLRVHGEVRPRTFRSGGGAWFQPEVGRYAATRLRPVVAGWMKRADPLGHVAEACAKRGLGLRGRVECTYSPAIAERHESAAVKGVFGDADPRWLCPANPDVRALLAAMVEDLSTRYPFETIELGAVSYPDGAAGGTGLPELGEAGRWLMRLCFCESCRQGAGRDGVEAEMAARSAATTLERCLGSGEPMETTPAEVLAEDEILAAYVQWQAGQVTSLVELMRRACRCRLAVERERGFLHGSAGFQSIAAHVDALVAWGETAESAGRIEPLLRAAADEAGGAAKVELSLSAVPGACSDSASLVGAVAAAARRGAAGVNLREYGMLPLSRLDWIKQAARYGQREAT